MISVPGVEQVDELWLVLQLEAPQQRATEVFPGAINRGIVHQYLIEEQLLRRFLASAPEVGQEQAPTTK